MGNQRAANEGSDSRHRRSLAAQPARIHNGQSRVGLPPVSNGQGPFFRQFPARQVERLSEAHSVEKDRATAVQLSEPAVQALYGIGRIHDLPSGLGELEHRADAVPVVRPVPSKALEIWVEKKDCVDITLRNLLESGSVLFSRAVSSQVPSALRGLTSVFGMGTGGSLSLLPPEILFPFLPSSFPENCTDPFPLRFPRLRFRLTLASASSRSASPTHCFRLSFLLFLENFT